MDVVSRRKFVAGLGLASATFATPTEAGAVGPQGSGRTSVHGFSNVQDFGAVGDGLADDTASLQAAINSGKPVLVPDGTFMTDRLDLPDGCTVTGTGYNSVLKLNAGRLTSVLRNSNWNSTGNRNITIRNLRLDGNHAANSGDLPQEDGGCVTLRNVDGFVVEDCWCTNGRIYGIFIGWSQFAVSAAPQGPSRRGIVVRNFISNCGVGERYGVGGIVVTNGEYVTIAQNMVWDCYNVGIRIESQNIQLGDQQNYVLIDGNQINAGRAGTLTGIAMVGRNLVANGGRVVGHQATHNIINGCRDGIEVQSTSDFGIAGNQILDVTQDGVRLLGASSHGIIHGNHLRAPGRHGITNGGAGDTPRTCMISGNMVAAPTRHGIYFDGGAEISIVDNVITQAGWRAPHTGDGILVTSARDGNCDGWVVKGNQIFDAIGHMANGIALTGVGFRDWLIEGNSIATAGQHGMSFTSLRQSVIANNIVRNVGTAAANTYDGILFVSTSGREATDNIVSSNSIVDAHANMRSGINFGPGDDTAARNIVTGNMIRENP